MQQSKECPKCLQNLDAGNFHKSKKNKDGLVSYCKPCVKIYNQSYHQKNFEKIAQQTATYRAVNAESIRSWNQKHYNENKSLYSQRARQWRQSNVEAKKAYDTKYTRENKHVRRAASKRYSMRFPEVISLNRQLRRARLKSATLYQVTAKDLSKLLTFPCVYCGLPSQHIDHVMPLSRGGAHSIGNLVSACASCNLSKGSKTVMEWKMYKAKLSQAETRI